MTTGKVSKRLLKELKPFGAIDWHTSKNDSRYIKFRDCRIGSIRIADHDGRKSYKYKFNIDTNKVTDLDREVMIMTLQIKTAIQFIGDFNPENYIVYNNNYGGYVKLDNYEQYKEVVLNK